MSGTVLLVRHPPVALAWRKRCYGRSDMGWSRAGLAMARGLAEELSAVPIDAIVHSGALRTARLAAMIARRRGVPVQADTGWLERDFGTWEGRTWHAIWRETGDLMDRMMTDPAGFRPGGGETGLDLSERACAAWGRLPGSGTTLVIAHGGPIAAVRAWQAGEPLEAMVGFIPACGDVVEVLRD
ncbi:histidine phosphatase family protein [Sphingomonas sp. PAMC 26617]|uniref:histidine phosphatase family protein n=1 Tax=Sphingomonas sp. PAMC 26617 TaxID=1112216 RepID=UPI00028888D7|nr:histidine phosphatase family protein [Sphingomonas sp. PAMC 26617]